MELIDGKKIATQVKQELADEVKRMKAAGAKTPHLVAVLVGNDPASETYVASKVKACQEVGFKPAYLPATPAGIVELLKRYEIPTQGKHCVVIGRSNIVGTPMAVLMLTQILPSRSSQTARTCVFSKPSGLPKVR